MEKLITPTDVAKRYGCSRQTARKYIRQCAPHLEKPLATPEWAFRAWEDSRVVVDVNKSKLRVSGCTISMESERVIVPRRR